jgi:hypothetical protein
LASTSGVRKTNKQRHFTHGSLSFNPILPPQVFTCPGDGISNTKIIKDFGVPFSLCEFGQANALCILLGSFGRVAGFRAGGLPLRAGWQYKFVFFWRN